MLRTILSSIVILSFAATGFAAPKANGKALNKPLAHCLRECSKEFGDIPAARKAELAAIADYIRKSLADGREAELLFVCTHNSRRSQIAQLWTMAAAAYYKIDNVQAYSGGTAMTAFNPRAIAAMERAGFKIVTKDDSENPHYKVTYGKGKPALTCYSKIYTDAPNPKKDFCVVMVCSNADKACPVVGSAAVRISMPYVDPKESDGTDKEAATYDERCKQIAREILYAFSQLNG